MMSFNKQNNTFFVLDGRIGTKLKKTLNIIASFLAKYEFVTCLFQNYILLGYDTALLGNRSPTIQKNLLPASKTIRLDFDHRLLF
jgi:hypothetical protein